MKNFTMFNLKTLLYQHLSNSTHRSKFSTDKMNYNKKFCNLLIAKLEI